MFGAGMVTIIDATLCSCGRHMVANVEEFHHY